MLELSGRERRPALFMSKELTTVREAKADDYKDIAEVLTCPGVVRDTKQLPYVSLDKRRKCVEEDLGEGVYYLVSEFDGKVAGNLGLHRKKDRLAHVTGLGMAVYDDYRDQGIGTALMAAAMDMADNWLNLKRVELDVYVDNKRAIHLYEKFGFVIEGTLKAQAFRDGEYVDSHPMGRVRD
jgi:putative acetyltransferase